MPSSNQSMIEDMNFYPRFFLLSSLFLLTACSGQTGSSNTATDGGLPVSYHSPDGSFSLRHPDGWDMKQNYELVTDEYDVKGTGFFVPTDRTKSTLYEGIFHVAQIPECPTLGRSSDVDVKGRTYHHAEWSGAGAGNLYEGETYSSETDSGCLVVTFYAHSCNLSPADCGPTNPKKYDRNVLFGIMRQMLETLKLL